MGFPQRLLLTLAGGTYVLASLFPTRHLANSRTPRTGARRTSWRSSTTQSTSASMSRLVFWSVAMHWQLPSRTDTLPVPSMDWTTRPPRYSRLHLRSGTPEQQGRFGLRGFNFVKEPISTVKDSRQDAPSVCSIRKLDQLCSPSLLRDAWPSFPGNTCITIEQHC